MLSIIIPYHNEGQDFIETTVQQIVDTIDVEEYEIIIVDDYSTEPLVVEHEAVSLVVRHSENKGVGAAFDTGVSYAKYGNIILMGSDIRFEANQWATTLIKYIEDYPKSIICTACATYIEGKPLANSIQRYGATIVNKLDRPDYNITTILEAKWITRPKSYDIYEIPCVLGAFYIIKKDWYKYIDGWWGHRQWGTLEPYISMKSRRMGGSTMIAKNVVTGHIFKQKDNNFHKVEYTHLIYNKLLTVELLCTTEEKRDLYNHIPETNLKTKAKVLIESIRPELNSKIAQYSKKIQKAKQTNKFLEDEADQIYKTSGHYSLPYTKSRYYKVWETVLKYVKGNLVDLGCGPGQFMDMCLANGVKSYTGYDNSSVAIDKAKKIYYNKYRNSKVWLGKIDLLTWPDIREGDTYTLIEILEHIDQDYKLLDLIPTNKQVVITVPNYLGGSHVRKFDTIEDVINRFPEIKFSNFEVINMGKDTHIIVAVGIKI